LSLAKGDKIAHPVIIPRFMNSVVSKFMMIPCPTYESEGVNLTAVEFSCDFSNCSRTSPHHHNHVDARLVLNIAPTRSKMGIAKTTGNQKLKS
jgi:hypothetical protein